MHAAARLRRQAGQTFENTRPNFAVHRVVCGFLA
jgi:hypothetical protein